MMINGYKGMDKNMTCRGMQYELGKTYHVNPPIKLCENGLHFCKSLHDVFSYYNPNEDNRFFEIEAYGEIDESLKKIAAEYIKVVRELEPLEIYHAEYGNGYGDGNGNGNGCSDGYGDGYCGGSGDGIGDSINYKVYTILILKD